MKTIHAITIGTEITYLRRHQKSGFGTVIGVRECELTITSICNESSFNTDHFANKQWHLFNLYKINGVIVNDGDVVHVKQSDTYIHNNCKVGDKTEQYLLRYDEQNGFKETIAGTIIGIII